MVIAKVHGCRPAKLEIILAFHKAYANNGTVQKLFYNTMC
jgi:hypothetical protein